MTEGDKRKIRLTRSLRKHIREKKASIKREFGKESPQMKDFLAWAEKKKQEKFARLDPDTDLARG